MAGCSKRSPDADSLIPFTPEPQQALSAVSPVPAPAGRSTADVPAGSIQFNIQLSQALSIYAALADAELQIEPQIQSLPVIIAFTNHQDLTRAAAIRALEETFTKQAGLVFEHRDARNVAVRQEKRSQ